jgi:hypothetical protein
MQGARRVFEDAVRERVSTHNRQRQCSLEVAIYISQLGNSRMDHVNRHGGRQNGYKEVEDRDQHS